MACVAAVDLGASSGRVSLVEVGPDVLRVLASYRFANRTVPLGDHLVWDVVGLYANIEAGLAEVAGHGPVQAIGIDTWGCDYGLIGPAGERVPLAYRDGRTQQARDGGSAVDRVHRAVPPAELYALTGTQFLPFNTLYQLAADSACGRIGPDDTVCLLPDLLAYWLTGHLRTEVTNASTTGLLDPAARVWSTALRRALAAGGLPAEDIMGGWAPLCEPGQIIGPITAGVAGRTGLAPQTPVIAVASHDTACAVAAVPLAGPAAGSSAPAAYVSCGTWSLVGVELDAPVLTAASREANFTNELGLAGTVRYLRNVMGLWVLDECVRAWEAPLPDLLAAAAAEPGGVVFEIDSPDLLPPGRDMPQRVARLLGADPEVPPPALARAILDSLASAYQTTIAAAAALSGVTPSVVHIVGGGAQNRLLCQLTADATGLPVQAGPIEASTLGNALVQAWALEGHTPGTTLTRAELATARRLVQATQPPVRYEPRTKEPS